MTSKVTVTDTAASVFDANEDIAVVVGLDLALGLVEHETNQVETLEVSHDLGRLVLAADRREVAEPIERTHRVEGMLDRTVPAALDFFLNVGHLHAECTIDAALAVIACPGTTGSALLVVGGATDKATEDDFEHRRVDEQLVIGGASFEMKQLHADGLRGKYLEQMIAIDAVLGDESLENVETLGRQHVYALVLEDGVGGIAGVLDEAGIHKVLADALGHVAIHAKSGSGGGGDDATRLVGVGYAVGLGELEMREVLCGLVGGEGVVISFKVLAMCAEFERDDERSKEVMRVLGEGTTSSGGLHHAAGGLLFGPGRQVGRQTSRAVGGGHDGGEGGKLLIYKDASEPERRRVACAVRCERTIAEKGQEQSMRLNQAMRGWQGSSDGG